MIAAPHAEHEADTRYRALPLVGRAPYRWLIIAPDGTDHGPALTLRDALATIRQLERDDRAARRDSRR